MNLPKKYGKRWIKTEKEGKLPKTCDHYRKVKNINLLNFDDIYTRLK